MQATLLTILQNGFILIICLVYAIYFALKSDQKSPTEFAKICFLTLYLAPIVMLILQVLNVLTGEIQENYLLATSMISPVLSTILSRLGVSAESYFIFQKNKA